MSEIQGNKPLTNLLEKIRRILLVLLLAPLYLLEEKERERELQERLKRK